MAGRQSEPDRQDLAEAGLVVPHLPAPYGLAATPMHQLIIDIVAEHVLGLPREPNVQKGMTWAEAQRARPVAP